MSDPPCPSSDTSSSDAPSPPEPERDPEPTLYEEMAEALALSMLIFLYADLRMMSQTGRIALKFENIAVDSDYLPRYRSDQLSGMDTDEGGAGGTEPERRALEEEEISNDGLSTAQIMACLLLELRSHVETRRTEREESKQREKEMKTRKMKKRKAERNLFAAGEMEDDKFANFASIKTRKGEEGMSSLLKAYAKMIGSDLNVAVPHIEARRSVLSLAKSSVIHNRAGQSSTFEGLSQLSVPEEGEEGREEGDNNDEETKPRTYTPNLEWGEQAVCRLRRMPPASDQFESKRFQRASDRVKEIRMNKDERTDKQYAEVTDALFAMGKSNTALRASIVASGFDTEVQKTMTKDELGKVMKRAVESRIYNKLDFMSNFFRKGTISQLMVMSKARVVWINDWFPIKDLTYAIAIDIPKKRVVVVFRGAITYSDWKHAFSYDLHRIENPIKDNYPGKRKQFGIYQGFYTYLFRVRKDTGTSKYDEIANRAHRYAMEKIGPGYKMAVCGHSLGAALSTVFAFHASTEERFTKNAPIKVITFGSPYVGGHGFAESFRHQEETKKLQYVRFYNHNDIFAHIPSNFRPGKSGSRFTHVGIAVRVKPVPHVFQKFRTWKPEVFYVGEEGWFMSYCRAINRSFLLNMSINPPKMHTLAELQKRLMDGSIVQHEESFEHLQKSIDSLYDMLASINFHTTHAYCS